jgi:hypothetical protein
LKDLKDAQASMKLRQSETTSTTQSCWKVHHTDVPELVKLWKISADVLYPWFINDPRVMKHRHPETRTKRGYTTYKIPDFVAAEVHGKICRGEPAPEMPRTRTNKRIEAKRKLREKILAACPDYGTGFSSCSRGVSTRHPLPLLLTMRHNVHP